MHSQQAAEKIINYMRTAQYPDHAVMLADAKRLAESAEHQGAAGGMEEVYRLRNLCLASEIYDLCGNYSQAKQVIQAPALESLGDLRMSRPAARTASHSPTELDMKLVRQRTWVVLFYGNSLYRSYSTESLTEALQYFEECKSILDACLPIDGDHGQPSFGLRSRIAYSQGIVKQRLQDMGAARKCFALAMDFQRKRYEAKLSKYSEAANQEGEAGIRREFAYGLYMTAKIFGLGLGWCSLRAGELLRARASISCARTLLESTTDKVHQAFMTLLYAITLRMQSRVGWSQPDLKEAINLLEPLTKNTEDAPFFHHPKHRSRALYELAVARLNSDKDDPHVDRLISEVLGINGARDVWRGHARLLQSRKLRLQGDAQGALEIAADVRLRFGDMRLLFINALMAEAEANIMLAQFPDANASLEHALELLSSNPLLAGTCHLHRARCLHRMRRHDEALNEFEAWRRYQPQIEDGMALQLAVEVKSEITGSAPRLEIDVTDVFTSSMGELERRFKGWVLEQYIQKYGNKWAMHAERVLGKDAGTLYRWANNLEVVLPTESKKKRSKGKPAQGKPG